MAEKHISMDLERMSRELGGRVVSDLQHPRPEAIALRFKDGAVLSIEASGRGFEVVLTPPRPEAPRRRGQPGPTRRQQEYLDFIRRYMHRSGEAPSELDIQYHFDVSAPSVNQMVRTLERRGFIERSVDWTGRTIPRSIRVIWDG